MSCASSDLDQTLERFQKDPGKNMYELWSQDTQCLYALVETNEVQTAKNVTKFNLRSTSKCHALLQILTKHRKGFKKIQVKL